ncbi:hypothetical protein [Actinoplanes sp. DH11]|uniref:hypothetical protein n=1 Tax=Actinoplanes sp. DH11 TaxID=2857011 RepID=UPI001E3C0956|nr:hypothetical protein [Actinoplanes sp. DH11]
MRSRSHGGLRRRIVTVAAVVAGAASGLGAMGAFAVDRYHTDRVCTDMLQLATGEITPETTGGDDRPAGPQQMAELRAELDRTQSRLLFNRDLRTAVRGFSTDTVRAEQVLADMAHFSAANLSGRSSTERAAAQVACGQVPVGIPAVQDRLDQLSA